MVIVSAAPLSLAFVIVPKLKFRFRPLPPMVTLPGAVPVPTVFAVVTPPDSVTLTTSTKASPVSRVSAICAAGVVPSGTVTVSV